MADRTESAPGGGRDVTSPRDDRCPSCEHRREFHSEPGCWYAVTVGTIGKASNCPCAVVDWPSGASCSERGTGERA